MAQVLRPLQNIFNPADYPDLIVGLDAPDDAAVYRLDDEKMLVVTTDFFPPVVDDAYDFGAIAAANAMSDVFAMGGRVLFALNIATFPDRLDVSVLSEILRGGAEKVRDAGAVIAGGHTVKDNEPKYGLAVIGIIEQDEVRSKAKAQVGDVLVLTKKLGTGVVTTALKRDIASDVHVAAAVDSMSRLNQHAAQCANAAGAHAMTDITGYGLLGHSHEMAELSGVDLHLDFAAFDWLPGTLYHAADWVFPGGMSNNRLYYEQWVTFAESITEVEQSLLFNPETSGGLLIAVAPEKANHLVAALRDGGDVPQIIGDVLAGEGRIQVNA